MTTVATACCENLLGRPDGSESTCGRPGATLHRSACVHEHVDTTYLCDLCASPAVADRRCCATCYHAGCIDCRVTVTAILT